MIPQTALLTHSSRKTTAGSTFIVSPDAKTGPNHARWVGFDTAPGGHVKWPPTAAIFPYFRAQWYFQMTTRRDFPVKVRPVDTYFTRWTSVSLRGHLFATPPDATDATDATDASDGRIGKPSRRTGGQTGNQPQNRHARNLFGYCAGFHYILLRRIHYFCLFNAFD